MSASVRKLAVGTIRWKLGEIIFFTAIDEPVPKSVTDLPDGYAVYRDFGVAYKNYKNLMQWDQARKTCVTDGGNLAVIDSFDKVAIVKGIADTNAVPWNGIHRLFDITEWTDVRSGEPRVVDQRSILKGKIF